MKKNLNPVTWVVSFFVSVLLFFFILGIMLFLLPLAIIAFLFQRNLNLKAVENFLRIPSKVARDAFKSMVRGGR